MADIDDLLHDLKCNHDAIGRNESIYSRAIEAIVQLTAEYEQLEKDMEASRKRNDKEWAACVEELASAGYRLMQFAGGASVEPGNVSFACKDGMFHEEIARQRIYALKLDKYIAK